MIIQEPKGLPVMEIFDSIQGEGEFMGRSATFIRLAGCNLRCDFCDTQESWVVHLPLPVTDEDIVLQCNHEIVVITGGEPCLHALDSLIFLLHSMGKYVCIETNGTLPVPNLIDWVTCSPKPPLYYIHPNCAYDELKYVVDENFTLSVIPELELSDLGDATIWLQPEGYHMQETAKKAFDLVMSNSNLRLGIQMHKLLEFK